MPTPTIRLRITDRLSALIERVWKAAPELRDDFPATALNAFALYAEYREGRPSMFGASKTISQDQPLTNSQEVLETSTAPLEPLQDTLNSPGGEAEVNSDDEWA
jgi:hypothetical protein